MKKIKKFAITLALIIILILMFRILSVLGKVIGLLILMVAILLFGVLLI